MEYTEIIFAYSLSRTNKIFRVDSPRRAEDSFRNENYERRNGLKGQSTPGTHATPHELPTTIRLGGSCILGDIIYIYEGIGGPI